MCTRDENGKLVLAEGVQAYLDEIINTRLGREKSKHDALQAELDKVAGERDTATKAVKDNAKKLADFDKLQRDALVLEVAIAKKVPETLRSRLVGDTKELLEKDADKLLADLGPLGKGKVGVPSTPSGGHDTQTVKTPVQRIADRLQQDSKRRKPAV